MKKVCQDEHVLPVASPLIKALLIVVLGVLVISELIESPGPEGIVPGSTGLVVDSRQQIGQDGFSQRFKNSAHPESLEVRILFQSIVGQVSCWFVSEGSMCDEQMAACCRSGCRLFPRCVTFV